MEKENRRDFYQSDGQEGIERTIRQKRGPKFGPQEKKKDKSRDEVKVKDDKRPNIRWTLDSRAKTDRC